MAAPIKVLTVGSVVGFIRDFFTKIKAIDAKHGKFDLVLCIGDFFGPPAASADVVSDEDETKQLLDGKLEAPIECYIMQGEYPLPEAVVQKFATTGGELCKNVFLMSKSGVISTAHGLRIACLGGIYEPDIYDSADAAPGFLSPYFSIQTVERLLSNTLTQSGIGKDYKSLVAIQSAVTSSSLIDILVTNVWPSAISQFSSVPLSDTHLDSVGAPPLDNLIRHTRPRYHFAAGHGQQPKFWEREPFVWDDEAGRLSRFVGLGAFGGKPSIGKKQRWFYAFSISPNTAGPISLPPNVTKNPFLEFAPQTMKRPFEVTEADNYIFGNVPQPVKRNRIDKGEPGKLPPGYRCRRCESTEHFISECPQRTKPPEGYVCKICNTPGHLVRDCPTRDAIGDTGGRKPKSGYVCRACGSEGHYLEDCHVANQQLHQSQRRGKRGQVKEIAPEECWFCLSNPILAKHLIVAIGSECYVTLPKGQIIPTHPVNNQFRVPGGGHVLIVPITHYPTYSTIPSDLAPSILKETEQYKVSLQAMYEKHGSCAVVFEVGRLSAKGGHAHVQAVPIPLSLKDKVEQAFLTEGRRLGIDFESDPEVAMEACAGGKGSYFKVDLPDGRKMVHLIKDHIPFGIQFGRQVLVSLLDMPNRLDWKACMLSEADDRADAESFKIAFAPFNPSS